MDKVIEIQNGVEAVFAKVANLTPKEHKNVIGNKWKYINAVVDFIERIEALYQGDEEGLISGKGIPDLEIKWSGTALDLAFGKIKFEPDWEAKFMDWLNSTLKAQQALTRRDTRWQVGEELCCLIGNLMLEDMEAGKKLGEQLNEYMKSLKKQEGL